jgi:hypothetical protein
MSLFKKLGRATFNLISDDIKNADSRPSLSASSVDWAAVEKSAIKMIAMQMPESTAQIMVARALKNEGVRSEIHNRAKQGADTYLLAKCLVDYT